MPVDLANHQGGGHGSQRGLPALVRTRSWQPGSVQSLLFVVARQHTEAHRNTGVERHPSAAIRDRSAHVLEMWCPAADDDPEGNDGVMPAGKGARDNGQLERARDPHHGRVVHLAISERGKRSCEQAVAHLFMPAGYRDGHP